MEHDLSIPFPDCQCEACVKIITMIAGEPLVTILPPAEIPPHNDVEPPCQCNQCTANSTEV